MYASFGTVIVSEGKLNETAQEREREILRVRDGEKQTDRQTDREERQKSKTRKESL